MAQTAVAAVATSPFPQMRRRQKRGSCIVPVLLGVTAVATALPWLPGFVGGLLGAAPSSLRGTSRAASLEDAEAAAAAGLEDLKEGSLNLLEKRDREQAKEQLLSLLEEDGLAKEIMTPEGKPLRGRVDETISRVERTSPTREPVYSDLLDGTWRVKFSGSYAPGLLQSPTRELALFLYAGGFSLGNALTSFSGGFWGKLLGVEAENLQVQIRGGGSDVESTAEVTIFGQRQTVSYKAELMPLSSNRMNEEILSLDLPSPVGVQEPPLALRRQLLVSYLDDTMMIVRDESGIADVLVREPSQADDWASSSAAVASDTRDPSTTAAQVAGGGDNVAAAVDAAVVSGAS